MLYRMCPFRRFTSAGLEITTDQAECFRYDAHCQEINQRLFLRMDLSDVVLIVGTSAKRIAAHLLILIACSDYFSDLLSKSMIEAQQREVILNDVDESAMEKLIAYCYTGNLDLDGDSIEVVLMTAVHLRLEKVVEGCCEFLQRHLHTRNCAAVAFLAEQLKLEKLFHETQRFICENFKDVSNEPDFFLLNASQLSEFIASDDLAVPSEEVLFKILMKWIEYEPETRRKHFTDFLANVRLPLMSPVFLLNEVEPLCNENGNVKLVMDAIKIHLLRTSNPTLPRNYTCKTVKRLLTIYTRTTYKEDETLVIASYDLWAKRWTICNTPIKCRDLYDVALIDDNLITVGGVLNKTRLDKVTSLNLRTMTLTEMTRLKTLRAGATVAVLNGSMFVIGGCSGDNALNSVEKLDSASGTWNFVASMNEARVSPSVVVFNEHLYASGGYNNITNPLTYLSSVERYNSVENVWIPIAPMKVERRFHCLVAFKGYLFAIGGHNNLGDLPVERYDPQTDTWTTVTSSPSITGSTKCASLGSDIFIYNKSKIYMINSESSCECLELMLIASDSMNLLKNYNAKVKIFAIDFEFNPRRSILRGEEFLLNC